MNYEEIVQRYKAGKLTALDAIEALVAIIRFLETKVSYID